MNSATTIQEFHTLLKSEQPDGLFEMLREIIKTVKTEEIQELYREHRRSAKETDGWAGWG